MTFPTHAIGYIRVSTAKQNAEDQALERQADVIRRFCIKRGINLYAIYEDVQSAVGAFNVERRPALQEATAHASRESCCVIVTEPTRLFRNVDTAESWFGSSKIGVFSVCDEKILSRSEFLKAVEVGGKVAKATSDATVKALGEKRASGAKLGSPADRSAANAASKRARAQRSDGIVDTLAMVLLEDSAYRDLSHRAFAELLNRRKITTGWNRAWTPVGVKRQRGLAEQRIREWQELDAEVISDDLLAQSSVQAKQSETAISASPDQEEDDKMRTLPTFGIF